MSVDTKNKAPKAVGKPTSVKRTPTILQMEAVECGAASLAIILAYYGRRVPLEELRLSCGVTRDGSNAKNLLRAAANYGLVAKGYSKSIEKLRLMDMPCILFWNFNHFLVLEGFKGNHVYLSDPAQGRYKVTREEFDDSFTGVVLTMEPGPDFKKKDETDGLLSALLPRIKHSRTALTFIIIASLFLVIPGLIVPSLSQIFIDKFLVNKMDDWVKPILLTMGAMVLLSASLTYIQQYYLLRLQTKLALSNSSAFLWHILNLKVEFFTQRSGGEITSRIRLNDKVASLLSGKLSNAVLNVVVVFFFAAVMFSYDVLLTSVGIVTALLNILALRMTGRARTDGSRLLVNESGKLIGTTMSGLSMIESLKAQGRESDFFKNWAGYFAKVLNAQQRMGWLSAKLNLIPTLLTRLNTTILIGVGAMQVMDGQMTMGMLVAFLFLMNRFIGPVNDLVNLGTVLQETEADMSRIDDVLKYDTDPTTTSDVAPADYPDAKLKGGIDIQELKFGYSKMAPPLVEGFNLELTPGKWVALVGGSGSGKSTVTKVITGLYEKWDGVVLFDGKERQEIPREVINNSLAFVDQSIHLFEGTIRENLSFWDETVEEDRIIQAAKDAEIHDFITSRKGGYDAKVNEGGMNFSGGQRQRLEIARALVNNPTILILDEATSALDPTTEKIVMNNIRRRGCTCILVAHRLSTIRDADEIIVMQKGQIVQRGSHQSLIEQEGLYANLISDE